MILAQVIDFVLEEKRAHKLRKEQSQSDISKEEVNRPNCKNNRSTRELRSGCQMEEKSEVEAEWGKHLVATDSDIPLWYTPICGPQEECSRKSAGESQADGSPVETPETSNWTQTLWHL